ncbi:MAG: hypothetical protein GXY32_03530 [Ruminococcaceae bacterium]|nr:hypothetical protein [Oscillospiraceae bacterium]
MKTLVIFYSYNGSTRRLAQQLAAETGADLYEVEDQKRPGVPFFKVPAAIGQKPGKVKPITANLAAYDKIIIMGPIWASHPAPPVNSIIALLPAGAQVELRMVSSGGSSEKDKVTALVQSKGAQVTAYLDIASGQKPPE